MSNPLFQQFGYMPAPQQQNIDIMQKFNQFKSMFQGNPQQMVQNLMQSGQMSQQQFQQYSQLANQFFGNRR